MRNVFISGTGQSPVGEHWSTSLRHLALAAVEPALQSSGVKYPDALYVGNMLSGELSQQEHLGALIADFCGLRGIEAMTIEASGKTCLQILAASSPLLISAVVAVIPI